MKRIKGLLGCVCLVVVLIWAVAAQAQEEAIHPLFPPLDEAGFLPEGEFIHGDVEAGVWLYASPTLRVQILRKNDLTLPLIWYEAEVWDRDKIGMHVVEIESTNLGKKYCNPSEIAGDAKAVFAISTDYYSYRVQRKLRVGIEIRGGQVISDKTLPRDTTRFPNLDALALLPGGRMKTFYNDEHTAQDYLDMGAADVLSFGPWLLREGEMNPKVEERDYSKQPRIALGMVSPGHYVSIIFEGRDKKNSVGESTKYLAQLMQAKGCTEAMNLDGGQTAVMLFMGQQINRIASYNGGKTTPRDANEVLVIGESQQVGMWNAVGKP